MHRACVPSAISRRHFILTAATAAGGLMVGIIAAPGSARAVAIPDRPWSDNSYAPSNTPALSDLWDAFHFPARLPGH